MTPMPPPIIEFRAGQVVRWPLAPDGWAQVEDLRRTRLTLLYRRRGRVCRVAVGAVRLWRVQQAYPLLPGFSDPPDNPLDRGVMAKRKRFRLTLPSIFIFDNTKQASV